MPKIHKPRAGSLQFWPRKRAAKILPSANFGPLEIKEAKGKGILGFIGYKVGMKSAIVRNLTPDSMTKNKQIILPVTIIECPPMKVLSARFYKDKKAVYDLLAENIDKVLKKKLKLPKKKQDKKIEDIEKIGGIDDIHVICYSEVKKTSIKKTPDIIEIGINGSIKEKFDIVKSLINKEIGLNDSELFRRGQLIDVHAVTKGHGLTGPVKRFGIGLRQHKSEKGVRRPGSLGPWHPARVTFRAPLSGQHGFFTRVQYNNKIVDDASITEKNINPSQGFEHYGLIKTNYIIVKGSVYGPAKRVLLLTLPLRETKKAKKQNFEFLKLV